MGKRNLDTVESCVRHLGRRVENRDPVYYIPEPVGLSFLGAVDRLQALKKIVIFDRAPKKERTNAE